MTIRADHEQDDVQGLTAWLGGYLLQSPSVCEPARKGVIRTLAVIGEVYYPLAPSEPLQGDPTRTVALDVLM